MHLALKMGRPRSATRSSIAVAREDNNCAILKKICCSSIKLNPEFSS